MHIFRWLMSHPIITAWVLAALAILLNLNMGPKGTQHEVNHQDAVHTASTATSDKSASEHAVTATTNTDSRGEVQTQASENTADMADTDEHQATKNQEQHSQETQTAQNSTQSSPAEEATQTSTETADSANRADNNTSSEVAGNEEHKPTPEAEQENPVTPAAEEKKTTKENMTAAVATSAKETANAKAEEAGEVSADEKVATGAGSADKVTVATSTQASSPSNAQTHAVAPASSETGIDYNSMETVQLLQLAREAFWQNNKDKSAEIYKILIARSPDNVEYKGELANVYWHQNKQKESAALYAEIAIPMLKKGHSTEVANMLGFIGVFFPEKARKIHQMMSEQ